MISDFFLSLILYSVHMWLLKIPPCPTNYIKMADELHVKGKDLKDLKVYLSHLCLIFCTFIKNNRNIKIGIFWSV